MLQDWKGFDRQLFTLVPCTNVFCVSKDPECVLLFGTGKCHTSHCLGAGHTHTHTNTKAYSERVNVVCHLCL